MFAQLCFHSFCLEAVHALYQRFINNDVKLEVELQSCILEKAEGFKPKDLGSISELILQHASQASALGGPTVVGEELQVSSGALEKETFDLLVRKIEHDTQVHKVYCSKMSNYSTAVQFAKLRWAKSAHDNNMGAADSFFKNNVKLKASSAEEAIRDFIQWMAEVSRTRQLDKSNLVPCNNSSNT